MKTLLDLGMKLRVPFNNDPVLVARLAEYRDYVDSVYLAPPSRIMITSGAGIEKKSVTGYDSTVKHVIRELKRYGLKTYMLLNASYVGQNVIRNYKKSPLRKYLKDLNDLGLRGVVITDILLARLIRQDLSHISIEVSVNAKVDSVTKALYWKEYADVDGICVSSDINKRPKLIKAIKDSTGASITMMAHEICIPDCPYEVQHCLIPLFHKGKEAPKVFDCRRIMMKKPWIAYRGPTVVPYNLRFYKNIVDIIKLAGRRFDTARIIDTARHYALDIDSRRYFSPLRFHPHEEPRDVFGRVSSCDRNCAACGWCKRKWQNHVSTNR